MADQAVKVAADVLSKLVQFLIVRGASEFGYLIHYRNNITMLNEQLDKLIAKSDDRRLTVDKERRNGRIISKEAKLWFEKAKELRDDAEICIQSITVGDDKCLNGWCPNINKCYKLGKEAKMKARKISELATQEFSTLSFSPPPLSVGAKSTGTIFKHFDSRKPIIERLKELLNAEGSRMIGVCGMGGSGKTTLVKEIANQVKGDKFDEIVFGTVSQEPDLIRIQDEIAYYLGLVFEDKSSVDVRANTLYQRLEKCPKGILVILDDLWKCLDLQEIGIPFGLENKRCKVVLTSRSKDVCKKMNCDEDDILEIGALSDEEAWTLFKDTVGDTIDALGLSQTAREVVKKCGGLPVALVILGKSLKGEQEEVWRTTLSKLQKSRNVTDMDQAVYESLKVSYDLLGDEEAKKLFLLCCLFPEDADIDQEDLFEYGMGLKLFKDVEYLTEGRWRVITLINKLKSRFLLLDGSYKNTVKVHDIVRVVGLSIANREEPVMIDVELNGLAIHGQQWPNNASYQRYTAISIISSKIIELPPGGLECPKLELLQIACENFSKEAVNTMFKGMKELKVVHMWGMQMPQLPSSLLLLVNLHVLSLDCELSTEGVIAIGSTLVNLEILSLKDVKELPKEIGNLVKLRLLDLSRCNWLKKISAGVIDRLKLLEELHTGGMWWGNEEEDHVKDGEGLANLTEIETLPNLIYLGIRVDLKFIRNSTVLGKLQKYQIAVGLPMPERSFFERSLSLNVSNNDTTLEGGLGQLLMVDPDNLVLTGDGLKVALDKLVLGGHRRLRQLTVRSSASEEVDCLAKCINATSSCEVFTKLEQLRVEEVKHLKHIVSQDGQGLAKQSFGNLQKLNLSGLPVMTYLFTSSVVDNLVHLRKLSIKRCEKMRQVFFNPGPSDTSSSGSIIKFMKLEKLVLHDLDSLICFCQGIEHVDFPQLKQMKLNMLPLFEAFCLKETVLSSDGNHSGSSNLQPLFNHKVISCNLVEDIEIAYCDSLRQIFSSSTINHLSKLESVDVSYCKMLEVVIAVDVEEEGEENARNLNHSVTCLVNLKTLSIKYCGNVEQAVLSSPDALGATSSGNRIVFMKLEKLYIWRLERLTCFCQGVEHVDFPQLKFLDLYRLPLFQAFCLKETNFPSEENHSGSSNLLPLFNDKVIGCSLVENIEIWYCDCLRQLFSSSTINRLLYLERVEVRDCKMLEVVIAVVVEQEGREKARHLNHSAIKLLNLKTLYISECENMEQVVLSPDPLGTTSNGNKIVFTKLERLYIYRLERLTCFCQGIEHVDFPQLKLLDLYRLPVFQAFCSKETSFPLEGNHSGSSNLLALLNDKVINCNLVEEIEISFCDSLRQLFSSSTMNRLSNLERVDVSNCKMLEVVAAEDVEEEREEDTRHLKHTVFFDGLERGKESSGKLWRLILSNLPAMTCPFTCSVAMKLVHLQRLSIRSCGNIEQVVLGPGPLGTTSSGNIIMFLKLENILLDGLERLICFCQGIERVDFPQLKWLKLYKLPLFQAFFLKETVLSSDGNHSGSSNLQPLFNDKVTGCNFIEDIEISSCDSLRQLFSSSMMNRLLNLERIDVSNCKMLEVVTAEDVEEEREEDTRHLKHTVFYDGRKESSGKQWKLILSNLPAMTCLFTCSVAIKLVHLERLSIRSCGNIEQVVLGPGPLGTTSSGNIIMFMKLENILLDGLERLTSFCQGIERVDLPQLKWLKLYRLPLFQAFFLKETILSSEGNHNGRSNLQLLFNDKVTGCNFIEDIEISFCDSLRQLFSSSTFNSLLNLESVDVSYCKMLEVVIAKDVEEGRKEDTRHLKHTVFHDGVELGKESSGKLWRLVLSNLPAMTCPFTCSVAIKLVHLQRLYITECRNMEQVVLSPGPLGTTSSGEKIVSVKLEDLVLKDLDSLICFYHGIEHVNFPQLTQLELKHLPLFQALYLEEAVSALEENQGGNSNLQPVFKVKDSDCNVMLERIYVWDCDCVRQLFFSSTFKRLLNLKIVDIWYCKMLEVIIARDDEEEGEEVLSLGLEELNFVGLPRLKSFCNANYALQFPELKELTIRDCPEMTTSSNMPMNLKATTTIQHFFGKKPVAFPSLETLSVRKVDIIEDLWCSQLPTCSYQKLRSLTIDECDNLVNVFPTDFSGCFPSLQDLKKIRVWDCLKLRNLIPSPMFKVLLNLERLEIVRCEMLEVVIAGDYDEEGEEVLSVGLEELHIDELPRLKSFCNANYALQFLKLKELRIWNCPEMTTSSAMLMNLQTATTIQHLFGKKAVAFPSLEKLSVRKLHSIAELWYSQLRTSNLQKLRFLTVEECDNLVNMFPKDCFPSLKDIKEIYVKYCPKLRNLFPSPTVEVVLNLEILEISSCQRIEQVFANEMEEKDDGRLSDRLISLCELNRMIVQDCPMIHTFSECSVSTPKLDHVEVDWDEIWYGDLKTTIQHPNFKKKQQGKRELDDI